MLYQKYRPQNFNELIGQDYIKEILLNALRQDKISHAYLFSGPRGTGKTTTARLLAKALNCLEPAKDFEPCNKCINCLALKTNNFMDLVEIDAASNRGIDDIRELRSKVMLATSQGKYKVYIIDEIHMLSKEAFNALLKTLEEPPKNVVFILATTEPFAVPETIISRCQRFDFKPLSAQEILGLVIKVAEKEKMKMDNDILQLIAIYASGSSRDALSFLEQINSLKKPTTLISAKKVLGVVDLGGIIKIFDALSEKNEQVLGLIRQELERGYSVPHLINGLLKYLEDLIFIKNLGEPVSALIPEFKNKMKKQAQILDNADLSRLFSVLIEARYLAKDLENNQLPLEIALLKFIKKKQVKPLESEKKSFGKKRKKENLNLAEEIKKDKIEKVKSIRKTKKTINLSKKEFDAKWEEVIEELKKYNHSVATFLNKARVEFSNNELLMEVPFLFYQKILTQPKNNQKIRQVIHNVFHSDFSLQIFVKDSNDAQSIKKAFGI